MKLVEMELREIRTICRNSSNIENPLTDKEVLESIKSLNKGKSAGIYNLSAEHWTYGASVIIPVLTLPLNKMLELGTVPESMKLGYLTPVYKRKGSNLDAKNYRGITVTPILSKVLESVITERIKPIILEQQNKLQRGFTENSSPINCSLIIEESIIVEREVPEFSNNCALPDTRMTLSAFVLQTCLATKSMLANAIFSIFKMATMIFKMAVKMIII